MMEEDEPTQPGRTPLSLTPTENTRADAHDPYFVATQLVMDPRRLGHHNSGLSDDDLTDIFCILHPASMPAYRTVAQIAQEVPEHTIGTTGERIQVRGGDNIESTLAEPGTFDLAVQGVTSRDIALRLSARLKDPLGGFRFGRHLQRCDFIIGNNDAAKRISNVHFRIYITEHGVIMLEDQSTNGTLVEGQLLRAKEKENGHPYKHTLQQGSLIALIVTPPEENLKFVVRIPQREGLYEELFENNLKKYFKNLGDILQKREAQRMGPVRTDAAKEGPPDIFAPILERNHAAANPEVSRHAREWRGGVKYNKVCTIGKGAFATVYMISAKFDGTCYAAKELEKRRFIKNGVLDQKVDTEMKIMKRIKHPNIVQYIEHIDWDDYLYLIMDYVPFGDLGDLISQRGRLPEKTVKSMASQLLSALKYLHTMGITHRDVKPDNILIQKHDPFHVKLTDFGLSKMINDEETFLQTFCGTLLYCAPEVYSEYQEYDRNGHRTLRHRDKKALPRQRYSQAVDLWSLGGVIFYALSGNPPYPAKTGTSHQQLLNNIMGKPLDIRPLRLAGVSEEGIQFVRSMLQVRPEYRPSIAQLQARPWLRRCSETISNVDDDEVDMIGEVDEGEEIEHGASQLSLQETIIENIYDVDDEEANMTRDVPDMANQSNFVVIHSSSSESVEVIRNPRGNPRLFGEVSASALRSSGVIPQEHLNLPISQNGEPSNSPNVIYSSNSAYTQSEPDVSSPHMGETFPRLARSTAVGTMTNSPKSGQTAPSLFGAEWLVGQLQMNSPSPTSFLDTAVSTTGAPTPGIQESIDNLRRSLRHPRQDISDPEDGHRAPKRVKSSREIDIPLSKTIYWDPKDKSTWHDDYPVMMNSQYNEVAALAKEQGEEFQHGGKIFDALIGNYRKRTTQVESQRTSAAGQGREALIIRDERQLEEKDLKDTEPETSHEGSPTISGPKSLQHVSLPQPLSTIVTPSRNEEFKHPRRILGKFIATSDSVIPSIIINVTEDVTSWGRGLYNTNVYPDANEDRIPKYAFKLILWRYGLETNATQFSAESLSFWIATKARMGIKVNGMHVRTHDRTKRHTSCKYWGEIRHGDMVTVWTRYNNPSLFLRFKFECYFGVSQKPRPNDVSFSVLPVGEIAEEIDRYCERKEVEWERANARAHETQARLEAAQRSESSSGESSRDSGSFPR